jgi:ATP-dependent helicase HrpA
MLLDQHAFRKRVHSIQQRSRQNKPIDKSLVNLNDEIIKSIARREQRLQALPSPTYPDILPVSEKREIIKQAINNNQVIIVAGETGSGKTTQLPKICLELGRGVSGMIGHTQPRRIAARTLATRIASELQTEVGHSVGYKIRFSDRISPDSYIKVMTDGILLAESQGDHWLNAYDTLILDEAHERSLNIDFLLGYLKELLPKRPDLKLIITSATIDTERFASHFDNAPVVEVSGRTYPVEVRYRPLVDIESERETDLVQGIIEAVDEISTLDRHGDILVFLPGEREIREVAEALRKHHPINSEILPLFARLSAAEQNRVFQTSQQQRIVLATNVAETSLTVPGIRYVIDPGLARMSRYSYRSKVQRLPIERISQASANQRKGRCGRIAPGVCIRLYSEEDFLSRPEFTEPEILRTNLASVILKMISLGLGDVAAFPFVEPPDSRMITDGYKLLHELGAVDKKYQLTNIGRQLAHLPIDPRLGRMLLATKKENALTEVLVIVSALSIQDPRERPVERQQAADEKHKEFQDEQSDFLTYLQIWQWFHEQKRHLTRNKLRKLCKQYFLSYLRLLEWEDIHHQLSNQLKDMKLRRNTEPAEYHQIHRALLTGLLGHLAMKQDNQEYLGTRNKKLRIFPGSNLFKKGPKWLMAAELVETTQLYARNVARIEPEWVEQVAAKLCKPSYSDPHWEKKRAQVVAFERLTLYGLPIVAQRKTHYGPIDPQCSREIFIRAALVQGEYRSKADFFQHNQDLINEVEQLEHKSRRRDVLVDEEQLFQFYDAHISEDIYNGIRFEKWYKETARDNPRLLYLEKQDLMRHEADTVTETLFPDFLETQGVRIALKYHFDPNHQADGVTAIIPLAILNQLHPERFEWLVPGFLKDKIIYLIKALPKQLRKNFIPAPDHATACVEVLQPAEISLTEALAKQLMRMSGIPLDTNPWASIQPPAHLMMNFEIIDQQGKLIGTGRDLVMLQEQFRHQVQSSFSKLPGSEWERENINEWDFDNLPESVELKQNGLVIRAYPTLLDQQDSVALKLVDSPRRAAIEMRQGLRRLFLLQSAEKIKYLKKNLPNIDKLCLLYNQLGNCESLKQGIIELTAEEVFLKESDNEIRNPETFQQCLTEGQLHLIPTANEITILVENILTAYQQIKKRLKGNIPPLWLPALQDISSQLGFLIYPNFLSNTPLLWLKHFPRYLQAIELRLDKLPTDLERDRIQKLEIERLWGKYQLQENKSSENHKEQLYQIRWMIEELRVSIFAQQLKTALTVSVKRIEKQFNVLK